MAKQKNFKNPAMDFISPESIEAVDGKPEAAAPTPKGKEKPPAGYRRNPEYIETRSKRFQLLIQPSRLEAVKARAEADGVSMGEIINRAIEEYLSK